MQAWLNLTPKGASLKNRSAYGDLLPDLAPNLRYLPMLLHEIGTAMSGGMSLSPLTHTEIRSWCWLSETRLTPFEARAVRRMSERYAAIASDKDSPCPVDNVVVQATIDEVNIASWIALAKHD